jgi:hypothetical protein
MDDLQKIWAGLDAKLDRNWKLNLELIRQTNLDKVQRKMTNLIWMKGIGLAFYVLSTILFVSFTASNWATSHIAAAGIILSVWTLAGCITFIRELSMISQLDYAAPITTLQKNLNQIKLVIISHLRVAVWIAPLYFVFIIVFFKVLFGIDIVAIGDPNWIWANGLLSVLVFLPAAIWVHIKLSPKNADKKWMNGLLRGNGSQVSDAMGFLTEIERFEEE